MKFLASSETEWNLIGGLLLNPQTFPTISTVVGPGDFTDPSCQWAFETIRDGWETGDDFTGEMVIDRAPASMVARLSDAMNQTPTSANAFFYAREVKKLSIRRTLSRIMDDGLDPDALAARVEELRNLEALQTGGVTRGLDTLTIDAESFSILDIPPRRVILEPFITEASISLVYAYRGIGKTMFVLSLADCVTKGLKFGPWRTISPVPVLFVDGELPAPDLQERLRDLEKFNPGKRREPLWVLSDAYGILQGSRKFNLSDTGWRERLKVLCLQKGVKLLALDNFSSLYPGIDENAKDAWDPINQWLLSLRFSGIASIGVHHTGKDGSQRGTSGREDNLDNSILLERSSGYRTQDGCYFTVKFKKSRVRTSDLGMISDVEFNLDEIGGRPFWSWGNVRKQTKAEVVRLLAEGYKQVEIADSLGIAKGTVSKLRTAAIEEDLITKNNGLTLKGSALLEQGGDP